jgi:Ca2+-binding RTX toxin-like protein
VADIVVSDVYGHSTVLDTKVVLGMATGGVIDLTHVGHDAIVYGFGGNDTITSSQTVVHNDTIYAGAGNDTIQSGIGNDVIFGGSGADAITLNHSGSNVQTLGYFVSASGTLSSDSNSAGMDTVAGFVAGTDLIHVVATGVSHFDPSHLTSLSVDPITHVASLDFTDAGAFTSLGALQIGFASPSLTASQFAAAISYDLTGTSGNDVLVGGPQADRFVGGPGADIMTGGGGANTYVINPGDSTPVVTSNAVTGFDVITDFALLDGSAQPVKDTIDFQGLPTVMPNSAAALTGVQTVGSIASVTIQSGMVTFMDSSSQAISSAALNLADAVSFVSQNLTGSQAGGVVVGFLDAGDTYVFEKNQGAADVLVKLSGRSATGLTTDATDTTLGHLFIA